MNKNILGLFAVFAISLCARTIEAQPAAKVFRLAVLSPRAGLEPPHEVFRQRLRDLGYVDGQSLSIEWRFWDGKPDLLNKYVAEVVGLKVDVIVANNTASIQAAKKATTTIPIVMQVAGDPVENGLVASLERPGGNVTGLTSASSALYGKRLELAKEIVPKLTRVGVLWEPSYVALTSSRTFKEVEAAAGSLQLKLEFLEVNSRDDFESAFRKAINAGSQAIIHLQHPMITTERKRIAELALKNRLPAIYADAQFIDAGGLMSYGADSLDLWRRGAEYVDKILKGAKPADMSIGQPTKFELVINTKVAQAIGLTIPQAVLARADKVIK